MSSQHHQRTNQLRKKKHGERTRITPDNNNNGTTTKQTTSGNITPSRLSVRAKRRRISSTRISQTDSGDSLLVVYDRKAKEVIGVKEETVNISYSDKKETNINNSRKKKNSDNTNNNECYSTTTSCTDPNQTVYGDGCTDIVKVDTKSNNNDRNEISKRGGEEKKYGSFQFKSVKKFSTIKGLSPTTTSKNKKDQQKKVENSQMSSTIKTSSSLRKRIFSGSIQLATTTQRPTPPRQTTHRERKWNNKWKRDFPWLERGVNLNGREVGMCLLCQSAGKKNSFANDGSTNLQYSAFLRHQTNREHRQAVLEKQILKQGTNTADCSAVTMEHESTLSSNKLTQPIKQEVIKDDKFGLPSSSTPSSALFYLTTQPNPAPLLPPTSMVQSVYPLPSSSYQQQHHPIAFPSYSTACIDDCHSKTQPSRVVTPFYDDDQKISTSPKRVFLLSKKAPPLQLSGDLLILQEGLESWTTSSGISSLIESLEGCSAATPTTSTASSRAIVPEELPSFSSTSVKSPTPFKKAYVESEHADGILKSLSWLWRTNKLCDAVICSGETKIMLHRLILFAVSPHLLEKNIRDGAELEVNLPSGISDEALATFVAFLYDGVLNLTEYNYKDIERVGNLLKVEKVQRYCREFANSLAEYKLHQPLPMPMTPVMDGGNPEYVGKRKRGRPSKQTVVLNLGDDHSLGDRLDPSHYLQSGELSNYHSMTLSGPTMSRMNSDMPVVFPDSQEYCLPSTSQTSQLFHSSQGHVKTEPYQQTTEFCSPFHINPKGSKSDNKEDADHISSFVSHESSGKSSTTMDIQTTTTNNGGDEDNSTTANNNNDNAKNSTSSATTEKNSSSKSSAKSLSSPSSKGDGGPSETMNSSPYPASVVASSGDGFSLYSLASS